MKEKTTINVTQFRKEMFAILDKVYKDKDTIILEKSGIPLVEISPISSNRESLADILRDTKGSWSEEDVQDWEKSQAQREKIELEDFLKRKKLW